MTVHFSYQPDTQMFRNIDPGQFVTKKKYYPYHPEGKEYIHIKKY